VGAVQEGRSGDAADRQVLWLDGTGQDALSSAALALYDSSLGGTVGLVDATGRVSTLGPADVVPGANGPGTAQVAAIVAAVLVAGVLALQLLWPRRSEA